MRASRGLQHHWLPGNCEVSNCRVTHFRIASLTKMNRRGIPSAGKAAAQLAPPTTAGGWWGQKRCCPLGNMLGGTLAHPTIPGFHPGHAGETHPGGALDPCRNIRSSCYGEGLGLGPPDAHSGRTALVRRERRTHTPPGLPGSEQQGQETQPYPRGWKDASAGCSVLLLLT